jgi:hypothetical protein
VRNHAQALVGCDFFIVVTAALGACAGQFWEVCITNAGWKQ